MVPSPVVELNRAVAVGMADGPDAGLRLVDELDRSGALTGYHLLPATRADLLRRLGRHERSRGRVPRRARARRRPTPNGATSRAGSRRASSRPDAGAATTAARRAARRPRSVRPDTRARTGRASGRRRATARAASARGPGPARSARLRTNVPIHAAPMKSTPARSMTTSESSWAIASSNDSASDESAAASSSPRERDDDRRGVAAVSSRDRDARRRLHDVTCEKRSNPCTDSQALDARTRCAAGVWSNTPEPAAPGRCGRRAGEQIHTTKGLKPCSFT